jgi:hypothetical protein
VLGFTPTLGQSGVATWMMLERCNKVLNIQQVQNKEFFVNLFKLITFEKLETIITTIIE